MKTNNRNILLGVLAGVVVGMILAPEKGSLTRQRIKGQLAGFGGDLAGSFKNLNELAGPYVKNLNGFAGPYIDKVKNLIGKSENPIANSFANSYSDAFDNDLKKTNMGVL
ncbi:MAG TPA: YtxH domain-containing protein [Cytophagaceae bacterium]|jgi:gas vesicle protein